MSKPNFRIEMKAPRNARVEIYDVLGPSWAGMIDAKSVSAALEAAGELDTIELRINSPGGVAWEGLAIHNLLKDHPATVNVVVDGVAASAASLIAMAGDTVRIPKNALLMIHDPYTMAWGGEADLQKAINTLASVKEAAVATYAAKSGKSPEQIAQWMTDETWFTGQEAVDAGLADVTEKKLPLAKVEPKSQVQQLYQKAPTQFASLVALAAPPQPKEPKMADETKVEPKAEVAPAVPQLSEADLQKARDEATKVAMTAERERVQGIVAVCNKAGKPDLAQGFIEGGKSLAEVNAKMVEVLCESRPPIGDAGGKDPLASDANAKYKAEFAKDKAAYAKAGMTEDEYVKMRRIDDGLDMLAPAAKA